MSTGRIFDPKFNERESTKSSVDDSDMELGIVRVRVGLSYDPLRLSPSPLICISVQ